MEFLFIWSTDLRLFDVNSAKFQEHLFVKQKWTAVYLNSIEQFPEFQSDDVDNFCP